MSTQSLTTKVLHAVIKHLGKERFTADDVHKNYFPKENQRTIYRFLCRLVDRGVLGKDHTVFFVLDSFSSRYVMGRKDLQELIQKSIGNDDVIVYFNGVDWSPIYDDFGKLTGIVLSRTTMP
jgi:hypothetical protein